DRLARLEVQSRGQSRIQSLEARAVAVDVVEELQTCRTGEPWRESVRQVVSQPEPRGRADVRHVGLVAHQRSERVAEPDTEGMHVDQVEDVRVVELACLVVPPGAEQPRKED